jgi:uncharacterized protein
MSLIIFLVCSELLTMLVIRQHFKEKSTGKFYASAVINTIFSIYFWIIFLKVKTHTGFYDDPGHIWLMMNLAGAYCVIVMPRIILILLHFTGKLIHFRKRGHIRSLTNTGLIIWLIIFTIIVSGSSIGRFNFRSEEVSVKIDGLNKDLEGLTLVQISDLHLPGFYHHNSELVRVMEKVNSYKPDILINTGDFTSFGWREFRRNDTILSKAKGRLGSFAVIGNHDIGTYNPDLDLQGRDSNIIKVTESITASGYKVLTDTSTTINIGKARVSIIGVITRGRYPDMQYGDLRKAVSGTDSSDFRILLSHDPNQWDKEIKGKTKIELTFAGHTHGMQIGIMTKWFRWSPSKYFYPKWNGLYSSGNQYLYVNRGLGVMGVPFRIWMPPEITVIRLSSK